MVADLSYGFSLPATPKTVFEMLTNPDFLTRKIELAQSGEYNTSGSAPELRIEVTRTVTADLPSMVRKFVGEKLIVKETQNWKQLGADLYQADFGLKIPNAPVDIAGLISLSGSNQTDVSITAKVKVNVPIFGASAEPHVVETIKKVLLDEQNLCRDWVTTKNN